jgi:hypothetical protein
MKRTKKEVTAYRQAALAILRQFGAQVNEANHRDYVVATRLGPLYVSVWDNMLPCKFEDVVQARAELPHAYHDRLNPFSGKWNFNGGLSHDGDMTDLAHFQHELRRLLPEGYQPNPDLPLVPYEG